MDGSIHQCFVATCFLGHSLHNGSTEQQADLQSAPPRNGAKDPGGLQAVKGELCVVFLGVSTFLDSFHCFMDFFFLNWGPS